MNRRMTRSLMPARRPRPSRRPTLGLTATEISWLHQLASMVRAAPNRHDRHAAIMIVVWKAREHRNKGVFWSQIAVALSISEQTLRRWRRMDDAKPLTHRTTSVVPPFTALPVPPPPPGSWPAGKSEAVSAHSSQNQFQHQSLLASTQLVHRIEASSGRTTPIASIRRILVISGDPRPGGNMFGPEAAIIRRHMSPAYVDVRERACIELAELSYELDTLRPTVLHIAAHSAFGGLFLSLNGSARCVGYEAFAATIERSSRPRLIVLCACGSHEPSRSLTKLVGALIAWPAIIDDDLSELFASQLYRSLARGQTIATAHADACAALDSHPVHHHPVLDGTACTGALF